MHLNQQIYMMHSDLLPFPKSAAEDFDFNASSYKKNLYKQKYNSYYWIKLKNVVTNFEIVDY